MAITTDAAHSLRIDGGDVARAQRAARGLEAGTVMSMYALEDSYDAVSSR